MVRNQDEIDEQLKMQITGNPGITFSELVERLQIPESTLRYRLITLELEGGIEVRKSRNSNAYYAVTGQREAIE